MLLSKTFLCALLQKLHCLSISAIKLEASGMNVPKAPILVFAIVVMIDLCTIVLVTGTKAEWFDHIFVLARFLSAI